MSKETTIAISSSADNVAAIISGTPAAYNQNLLSHDNCLAACRDLLTRIQSAGMNDDLDRQAASYIEKTRLTVKKMNEKRAPVTKLFDQVRKEFTTLENDIDPAKTGTIPNQLQQLRNQYAALNLRREEERRRAEEAKRRAQLALEEYRTRLADEYRLHFANVLRLSLDELTNLFGQTTLENYDQTVSAIRDFNAEFPALWDPATTTLAPAGMSAEEAYAIRSSILSELRLGFAATFKDNLEEARQAYLTRLPSKRAELQRAAEADKAEAARIKAEMAAREAEEAAAREARIIAARREEDKKAEADKAANLFDIAQLSEPAYRPQTKVSKKINITAPSGYMQVLSMWWAKEGSTLSKEELDKIFKKQIAYCERLANKEEITICDPGIEYIDDVKAK